MLSTEINAPIKLLRLHHLTYNHFSLSGAKMLWYDGSKGIQQYMLLYWRKKLYWISHINQYQMGFRKKSAINCFKTTFSKTTENPDENEKQRWKNGLESGGPNSKHSMYCVLHKYVVVLAVLHVYFLVFLFLVDQLF